MTEEERIDASTKRAEHFLPQFRMIMADELKKRICRVVFTKVNGEQRDMSCTLSADIIPQAPETDVDKAPRPVNESVLSAWDTNAQGWRSFRVENVISFT